MTDEEIVQWLRARVASETEAGLEALIAQSELVMSVPAMYEDARSMLHPHGMADERMDLALRLQLRAYQEELASRRKN